jgi:hypothetical protein
MFSLPQYGVPEYGVPEYEVVEAMLKEAGLYKSGDGSKMMAIRNATAVWWRRTQSWQTLRK